MKKAFSGALGAVLLGVFLPHPFWLLFAAAALVIAFRAFRREYLPVSRAARAMAEVTDLPAGAVKSIADVGLAEAAAGVAAAISGTVRCDLPLTSPISGKPCAAWRVDVEVGAKGGAWVAAPAQERAVPFQVMEGGSGILVLPEGARLELQAGPPRRVPRQSLEGSPLGDSLPVIDAALDSAAAPSTYRIREALLPAGGKASVCGVLCMHEAAAALGPDPEEKVPFVIGDTLPSELRTRGRARTRQAAAAVGAWMLAAALIGWHGAALHQRTAFRGRMYVRNETDRKISVHLASGRREDGVWNFDPHEGTGTTRGKYLQHGDREILFMPGDRLTLTDWRTRQSEVVLGDAGTVPWQREANAWVLDITPERLAKDAAPPAEPAPMAPHSGQVYVRNGARKSLEVRFTRSGGGAVSGRWSFDPGEGKNEPDGLRLTQKGSSLVAEEGDVISLALGENAECSYPLGAGPAEWREADQRWVVAVEDDGIPGRLAHLRVRNKSDWQVNVRAELGNGKYDAWDFEPHEDEGKDLGPVLSLNGKRVLFARGARVKLTASSPSDTEVPFVLGEGERAAWQPEGRYWLLRLTD